MGNVFKRETVEGVGINDYPFQIHNGTPEKKAYIDWHSMLYRCYNKKHLKTHPSYEKCSVCKEWLHFSNFKKWFDENYKEGFVIDKDILSGKNNKIYSPETCSYIPNKVNMLLVNTRRSRGNYPVGVIKKRNKYRAQTLIGDKEFSKLYNTPEEAFEAYKCVREKYIKDMAELYYKKGEISEMVYIALINYKIEITD